MNKYGDLELSKDQDDWCIDNAVPKRGGRRSSIMSLIDLFFKSSLVNEMKGGFGEFMVKNYARIFTDTLVLNDILINGSNGKTSQIDLLMIGAKGIFVAEVKTFVDAKVYGDGLRNNWYYYKGRQKHEIYSPIKQNRAHIEYLREFLSAFGHIPLFSVIVMICDDYKVSNINQPGSVETCVCNSLHSMKEGMRLIGADKPAVLDEAKRQEIYRYIKDNQIKGWAERETHKQEVKEYKQNLEECSKQKLCPYCKAPLVLRKGKYGEFYGCINYPKCRYTQKGS